MVRKLPPIAPGCPENMPPLPPNRRSKKPPCWPASAAERYCAPQPLSPSAISSDCRCAARSVAPPPGGGTTERDAQRQSLLIALGDNGCGAQYRSAALQGQQGGFFDRLFGGNGGLFSGPSEQMGG